MKNLRNSTLMTAALLALGRYKEAEKEALERFTESCRIRADDDPAAVAVRLRAYREQTAPVVEWYAERSLLRPIPAVGTVEEVARRVHEALPRA